MSFLRALLPALLLLACASPESTDPGECGPNAPCADGFECSPVTRRCVSKGGPRAFPFVVTTSGQGAVEVRDHDACRAARCDYELMEGSTATLTALPGMGWDFARWGGDCAGAATSTSLTIDGARTCAAEFSARATDPQTPPPTVVVSGSVNGAPGTVAANAAGGTCTGGACTVEVGATVTLVAPALGPAYRFLGWSGDAGCSGSSPTLSVVAPAAGAVCRASFVARVTVSGGDATASSAAPGALCGAGSCTVDVGQTVTLLASAAEGQRFLGWVGDPGCDGVTTPAVSIVATANTSCTAIYVGQVAVSASVSGATATVSLSGPGCAGSSCTVDLGATVTFSAPTVAGFRFKGWSGAAACQGTEATRAVRVTGPLACVATYVAQVRVSGAMPAGATAMVTPEAAPPAICAGPSCLVDAGAEVTLIAPVQSGQRLTGWSCPGRAEGSGLTVIAGTTDLVCTASYVAGVAVTGTVSGATGSVSVSAPPPAVCSAGTCVVDAGTSVTLSAPSLSPGSRFVRWEGGCSGTSRTVVLDNVTLSVSCTAVYVRRRTVTGLSSHGQVVARSSDVGADCAAGSSCTVDEGGSVELTVSSAAGFRFTGWSGGCAGNPAVVVPVGDDVTCEALYARRVTVTGTSNVAAASVAATSTVAASACTASSCEVDEGSSVRLETDDLGPDYRFAGWSGGCSGVALATVVSGVAADTTCSAGYVRRYTVSATATGGGAVTATSGGVDCPGASCTVDADTDVVLEATADATYVFGGWSGATCPATGTSTSPVTVRNTSAACTATFTRQTLTVSGAASPAQAATITASAPAGTCASASCSAVPYGTKVTFSSSTVAGWRLTGWSAGCDGGSVVATATTTCTASYVRVYTIAATAGTGGSVSANACAGASCTVDADTDVVLEASADATYAFSGWSGATCPAAGSATNPLTLRNLNATCAAAFARQSYTIAAAASPSQAATLTASASAGTCSGATCTGVPYGTTVTFASSTAVGWRLSSWSTGCAGGSVVATANTTCTASYVRVYTIAATAGTGGSVSAKIGTSTCTGASCTADADTDVVLTASADATYVFSGWSGATWPAAGSATNPLTLRNVNATCAAAFARQSYTLSAAASPSQAATLTASAPAGTCSGATCTGVPHGTTVTFASSTAAGWRLSSWSTGCAGGSVVATAATTCTATYVRVYTIAATAGTGGSVTAKIGTGTCTGASCTVDQDVDVTLTATANSGYAFSGWGGAACPTGFGTTNPILLRNQNATCVAGFSPTTFTVSAVASPSQAATLTASASAGTCSAATCTGVPQGTTVTFTSNTVAGWRLSAWSSNCAGGSVVASANTTCTASYVRVYTIAATAGSGGSVTAKIGTSTCPGGSCTVDQDVDVTLTATATSGYTFAGWGGATCPSGLSTTNPVVLRNQNATCAASFNALTYTVSGTASPASGGTIKATAPAGTCSGASCSSVPTGTVVTLTATATTGWAFLRWSAACGGATNPVLAVTTSGNQTCTASFGATITGKTSTGAATVFVTADDPNAVCTPQGITASCSATPSAATDIDVLVDPDPGFEVTSWSGPCTMSPAAPEHATLAGISAPGTCTAYLKALPWAQSYRTSTGTERAAGAVALSGDDVLVLGEVDTTVDRLIDRLILFRLGAEDGTVSASTGLTLSGLEGAVALTRGTGTTNVVLADSGLGVAVLTLSSGLGVNASWKLAPATGDATGASLSHGSDGRVRVVTKVSGDGLDRGQLTVLSDTGVRVADDILCEQAGTGCPCVASTAGPSADLPGIGTILTMQKTPYASSFLVAMRPYDGLITKGWRRRITFASTEAVPLAAAATTGGGSVIVGRLKMGNGNEDGFYAVLDSGGALVRGGRISRGPTLKTRVTGVVWLANGDLLLSGTTDDMAKNGDLWLAKVSAAGAISLQMGHGTTSTELGVSVVQTSHHLVGFGSTTAVGGGDLFALRPDVDFTEDYTGTPAAHNLSTSMSVAEAPTSAVEACNLMGSAPALTLTTISVQSESATPARTRWTY